MSCRRTTAAAQHEVVACHYDASTGELVPTTPLEVVPGVPSGQDGLTFSAAIRITGGLWPLGRTWGDEEW